MFLNLLVLQFLMINSSFGDPTTPSTSIHAQVKSRANAIISSQINARVKNMPLNEGASFKKNDTLIIFDCTTHLAEYEQAKAQYKAKKINHEANLRLYHYGSTSAVEVANSEAELASAKATMDIKGHIIQFCHIKAPFNGRLVNKKIHQFENVRQGDVLIEILANDDLVVEMIVPSKWLSWLQTGHHFNLSISETNQHYDALVTSIVPKVDAVSQSVKVIAKIEGHHPELISGMSGQAKFKRVKHE